MKKLKFKFPSPTGVNYYELAVNSPPNKIYSFPFPSPTGVNYYEPYLQNPDKH